MLDAAHGEAERALIAIQRKNIGRIEEQIARIGITRRRGC